MRIIRGYLKCVDLLNEWAGKSFSWLIVVLVVGMTYSTVMRYVFGRMPVWSYDFTYIVYSVFFMMGAAYTLRLKQHVRVDALYRFLSPRGKAIVDIFFTLTVFFPLIAAILIFSVEHVPQSWQMGEKSVESVIRIPIYPLKTVIPVAIFLLGLQAVAEFIRDLSVAITRKELQWK